MAVREGQRTLGISQQETPDTPARAVQAQINHNLAKRQSYAFNHNHDSQSKKGNVMRPAGRLRLGFYPLALFEAQRICRWISFTDLVSTAVDPCVGDGAAFEAITEGAEVLRYGIELDAYRAEQARGRIPNVVHGNTLEVHCAVESFSLLYLNPPYDWALGGREGGGRNRTEGGLLRETHRWGKGEGGRVTQEIARSRSS